MLLHFPLDKVRVTQPYKGASSHPGIDYGAPEGTPVYAAAEGVIAASYTSQGATVKEEGPPYSYGERVIITHPDGSQTTYNHLLRRMVEVGEPVAAGQQIGEVGNTGYSKGAHLHFEYRESPQSAYSDPQPLLILGPPPSQSLISFSDEEAGVITASVSTNGKIIIAVIVACGVALAAVFALKGNA